MEKQPTLYSRRDFLKMSTIALSGLAFTDLPWFLQERNLELPQPEILLATHIVDEKHPISKEYITQHVEPNLIHIKDIQTNGIQRMVPVINERIKIHQSCASSLSFLAQSCRKDTGTLVYVGSGFRSIDDQRIVYLRNNKDERYSATPGASQHHTGLAVDFTSAEIGYQINSNLKFEATKVGMWLKEHAWKHGFVESYINGHDGRIQEPWHYLYIGETLASTYQDLKEQAWGGDVFDFQSLYPQS
jgi:LAS superfamily LD-carboxypeptidase LdcB